jgi:ferredoxin
MIRFDERVIAGLTVRIDRTLCVGFGDCVTLAPDAFELDDEGIAVFRAGAPALRAVLLAACDACPVDAITVLDENGVQLVP